MINNNKDRGNKEENRRKLQRKEEKLPRIIKTKDIKNPIIIAEYKGEKIIRSEGGNAYYYISPKQPPLLEEKALLVPFEEALEIAAKIQRKADAEIERNINEIPHKVLVDTPIAKIIEGIKGKYDGAYFYVMPDGKCIVISEELAKRMIRALKKEYKSE